METSFRLRLRTCPITIDTFKEKGEDEDVLGHILINI